MTPSKDSAQGSQRTCSHPVNKRRDTSYYCEQPAICIWKSGDHIIAARCKEHEHIEPKI